MGPGETLCLEPSHLIPFLHPAHRCTESGLNIWEGQQQVNQIHTLQLSIPCSLPHIASPIFFTGHITVIALAAEPQEETHRAPGSLHSQASPPPKA